LNNGFGIHDNCYETNIRQNAAVAFGTAIHFVGSRETEASNDDVNDEDGDKGRQRQGTSSNSVYEKETNTSTTEARNGQSNDEHKWILNTCNLLKEDGRVAGGVYDTRKLPKVSDRQGEKGTTKISSLEELSPRDVILLLS
jgi:hypothetical protein